MATPAASSQSSSSSSLSRTPKADFAIEIDFERGSENPSRVFRAMSELIETFQSIDGALIESIDAKIEPVATIEDIEAGSIRTWLAYRLRAVDDEGLKQLDWKPVVGKYLVNAKRIIVKWLEGKTEITSIAQIEELERDLLNEAQKTDVTHFPSYSPIQRQKLLPNVERLTKALGNLTEKEKAKYITSETESEMNISFKIVPESIEQLLTHETIESTSDMILKVKKPDYLGDSMWEFRHGTRVIDAKITDVQWLSDFQNRKHDVRPGDSLRCVVKTSVRYGYDNEVVGVHHDIERVKEIVAVPTFNQLPLLPPEKV